MPTILAILVIFALGFYVGAHYGYEKTMTDVRRAITRVEKQARK